MTTEWLMARLPILDLAFVPAGSTPADALRNSLDLAQHAERWGYHHIVATAIYDHSARLRSYELLAKLFPG